MAEEATLTEKIWSRLLGHILESQEYYFNFTSKQIEWLNSNLIKLFLSKTISSDSIYKSLVYLNRNTKFGRYSLIFNSKIEESVLKEDVILLINTCKDAFFPELECLSKQEQEDWNNRIKTEMLCYNLYVDKLYVSRNPNLIFNCDDEKENIVSNNLCSCREEVLNSQRPITAKYITTFPKHIVVLSENEGNKVIAYSLREIDFMHLLLSKEENPYTKRPICNKLRKNLGSKYSDILQICRRAGLLGYKHNYIF